MGFLWFVGRLNNCYAKGENVTLVYPFNVCGSLQQQLLESDRFLVSNDLN